MLLCHHVVDNMGDQHQNQMNGVDWVRWVVSSLPVGGYHVQKPGCRKGTMPSSRPLLVGLPPAQGPNEHRLRLLHKPLPLLKPVVGGDVVVAAAAVVLLDPRSYE